MAIDTSIYNALLRPPKSVAEYDAEAMAGQQNRLALQSQRMQMDAQQRGLQQENMLAQVYRDAVGADGKTDRNKLYSGAAAAGLGAKLPGMQKGYAELDETDAKTAKELRLADKAKLESDRDQIAFMNQIIGAATDQASYSQGRQQMAARGMDVSQIPEQFEPGYVKSAAAQTITAIQRLDQEWKAKGYDLEVAKQQETVRNNKEQTAVQVRGQNVTAATAAAGRAQSAQQFAVSSGQRSQELQVRTGGKPMTAQQEAKYRTQIAKDHQSANTVLSNMDDVVKSAAAVKAAPGLSGATGLSAYIPSWPDSEASQAEVKLQNLEGKITSLGKAAAAMSGAVGPMAVQEWKIVRDMVAAIDPKKGQKSLLEQIALVEEHAKGASDRIREGYSKHYSADFERYPQFEALGGKEPPPAGPVRVANEADYAKLPSGAEFITPDGKLRRKK